MSFNIQYSKIQYMAIRLFIIHISAVEEENWILPFYFNLPEWSSLLWLLRASAQNSPKGKKLTMSSVRQTEIDPNCQWTNKNKRKNKKT